MHVFLKRDPLHPRALQLFKDMEDVNHPYIFRLIHRGETEDSTFAVYTFAIDFPLFTHLRTVKRLPDQVSSIYFLFLFLYFLYFLYFFIFFFFFYFFFIDFFFWEFALLR